MPLLWHGEYSGISQFEILLEGKKLPANTPMPSHKRLGKLAEDLFFLWVENQSRYETMFSNLQVFEGQQTIGELDAVLFDTLFETCIHVELVTKFYLYNPAYAASDIKAWIGPNRNDSLVEKFEKLKTQQLPLWENPTAQQLVMPFTLHSRHVIQRVLFKANLFVPLDFNQEIGAFNKGCIAGNYVTFSVFKEMHQESNQYFCPKKRDWLRVPESQTEWFKLEEVLPQIETFMQEAQSLMVWVKQANHFRRYIVVPYEHF